MVIIRIVIVGKDVNHIPFLAVVSFLNQRVIIITWDMVGITYAFPILSATIKIQMIVSSFEKTGIFTTWSDIN